MLVIHNNPSLHSLASSHHPVAQDWLPTEAKQAWAWSLYGWSNGWTNLFSSWVLKLQSSCIIIAGEEQPVQSCLTEESKSYRFGTK